MSLDAFLAKRTIAAWCLDGLSEEFGTKGTGEGWIGRGSFANFRFGDDLWFGSLFVPGGTGCRKTLGQRP